MHAFDVLGDPVRRRILEVLATSGANMPAGDIAAVISAEFEISQPAVSQHLKVLRENGFASMRAAGQRRLYSIDPDGLQQVDDWLERYRYLWTSRLDALDTELRRGRRNDRQQEKGQ